MLAVQDDRRRRRRLSFVNRIRRSTVCELQEENGGRVQTLEHGWGRGFKELSTGQGVRPLPLPPKMFLHPYAHARSRSRAQR